VPSNKADVPPLEFPHGGNWRKKKKNPMGDFINMHNSFEANHSHDVSPIFSRIPGKY
jgi:hypothetical protein